MGTPTDSGLLFDPNTLISNPGGTGVRAPSLGASPIGGSQVYLGSTPAQKSKLLGNTMDPTGARKTGGAYVGEKSNYLSYEEARLLPTTWDQNTLRKFVNTGIVNKLPGFGADMGMPEIVSAWDELVKSSLAFSKPGQEWTPWEVMDSYGNSGKFGTVKSPDGDWLLDAATGQKIKYIGPRTKTTTEKRVDLSSPEDVRAITTQTLTQILGRAPTAEEMAKYRTAMTGFEQAHPSVATTTTTLNDQGEAVSSDTTTSGGVTEAGRQQLITEQAKKGPEYGKFQSATTYFNAMMQMIGG